MASAGVWWRRARLSSQPLGAMKFGQQSEQAFKEYASLGLPPFPYKKLKKALKHADARNSDPQSQQSIDLRDWFSALLARETKRVDTAWAAAARAVLLAVRSPRAGGMYAKVVGKGWCAETADAAGMDGTKLSNDFLMTF